MEKKPEWLKIRVRNAKEKDEVEALMQKLSLHTICDEAICPNMMECFGRKTAAFMIMGRICTRNCTFCNVTKGIAKPLDIYEPRRLAEAIKLLNLKYVVITSVTRDDLPNGGAMHFAKCIFEIRRTCKDTVIEVLIPDFKGDRSALKCVIDASPEVISHNIETVPRLYDKIRPMAIYKRSLKLLERVKKEDDSILTKSGIMLGLSEEEKEVIDALHDLRNVGCEILTIGQYLAPSKLHHPVVEYITPEKFEFYKKEAEGMGFKFVASAPLVRSSYHASEVLVLCQP